jgi:hypothetical protein
MRISKHHLGIGFEVWTAQQTWFWFVANRNRNGMIGGGSNMIGAAATESEAEREARLSIEEISDSIALAGWEGSLKNLERYLSSVCVTLPFENAARTEL